MNRYYFQNPEINAPPHKPTLTIIILYQMQKDRETFKYDQDFFSVK